jgi:hypothetical protein
MWECMWGSECERCGVLMSTRLGVGMIEAGREQSEESRVRRGGSGGIRYYMQPFRVRKGEEWCCCESSVDAWS